MTETTPNNLPLKKTHPYAVMYRRFMTRLLSSCARPPARAVSVLRYPESARY